MVWSNEDALQESNGAELKKRLSQSKNQPPSQSGTSDVESQKIV
jgi:hypothetical protein